MPTDPVRRDLIAAGAGAAHGDACPNTTAYAKRAKMTPRNARYHAEGGPPALRAMWDYLATVDDPMQVAAQVMAWAKWRAVERLPNAALIERWRELLEADKRQEAEDTCCDMSPFTTWAQVERSHRIDAAYDLELAACAAELSRRRISRGEVLHG